MKLTIVKIGGNVLDDEVALNQFLLDFATVEGPTILVHGGGKMATRLGDKLGIQPHYVKGRRITDSSTLELVTMVYGGWINKMLVAKLQQAGCNGIGLTGADGHLIKGVKRPVKDVDFGWVGDIEPEGVNVDLIKTLLNGGIVPVVAPLSLGEGTVLNTNADTIASVLAIALSSHYPVRLIFCFEKKGVLLDVQDEKSSISHLTENEYRQLLEKGVLADGILPKLENAFHALHKGVREVLIGHAEDLLVNTTGHTVGTLITRE